MKRNGKTSAGRTRWRCTSCGASSVRRIDSAAKLLALFLGWLLGRSRQADMPGGGRTFRRKTAAFWGIWPMPPKVEAPRRVVYLDGIHLGRRAVVLIASDDGRALGWHLCRAENSRAWSALMSRIAAPEVAASDGGDVGWDKLTTFVDAYQQALSALDTGQVSGVVETDYGYHIIMCTDRFYVDGEVTSVDQIPEDLRNTFIQSIESTNQSAAYQAWLDQQRSEADIQINDMPADVPYNVDIDAATTEGDDAQADDAATE